jgi:hypothetical protein
MMASGRTENTTEKVLIILKMETNIKAILKTTIFMELVNLHIKMERN